MKLDMHCHVKEGSIDSKVSLDEYITLLKERGFDGMLITDHDTYKGYRHWKYQMKGKVHDDFVVLKGIEYDTCDGGHILCIMPEGVKMRLLELRGLPVAVLIDFVHKQHSERINRSIKLTAILCPIVYWFFLEEFCHSYLKFL